MSTSRPQSTCPVGANVTSVSFFYTDCGLRGEPEPWLADYYFGAYRPTFNRMGGPIATVQVDRRYVLGAKSYDAESGDDPHTAPLWVLYGARLKYTCPTTCT